MQWRCVDWLRAKREGNGDARKGHANRVVLTGEFDDDSDPELEVELERFLSADRMSGWQAAADLVGLPLGEFVVITLDRAAAAIRRAAEGPTPGRAEQPPARSSTPQKGGAVWTRSKTGP